MAHQRTSSVSSQRSSNGVILTPLSTALPSRRGSMTGSESSSAVVLTPHTSRRNSLRLSSPRRDSTSSLLAHLTKAPHEQGGKEHPDRKRRPGRTYWKQLPLPNGSDPAFRCPFRLDPHLLDSVLNVGKGHGQPMTAAECEIIVKLEKAAKTSVKRIPIILFTDIGKDRDDILALMALSVLHKLDIFDLKLVVVNIYPVALRAGFTRGVLDSLGLYEVPVAVGSDKPLENVNNVKYYYEDKFERMPARQYAYPKASVEVPKLLRSLLKDGKKARIITIGSLRDVYEIAYATTAPLPRPGVQRSAPLTKRPSLFQKAVDEVHAQGGHKWITKEGCEQWETAIKENPRKGKMPSLPSVPSAPHRDEQHTKLVPAEDATNNINDWKAAMNWHKFLQHMGIPFVSYTKISTFSSPPPQSIFNDLPRNELALTRYLRYLNVEQSWVFYWCTLYQSRRIRDAFDEVFYFANLTTWPRKAVEENGKKVLYWMQKDGNKDESTWKKSPPRPIDEALRPDGFPENQYEPCKPAPKSFMKFFAPIMKMTAYDVIAVCGAAGPDIANILGVCSPNPSLLPDHAGVVGEKFASKEDDRPTRFTKTGTDNITHPIALSALLKQALINCPRQR